MNNEETKQDVTGLNDSPGRISKCKPKWFKVGCGCVVALIVAFIALSVIAYSCSTPEEREQWAAERAERDKLYQAERAEQQRQNDAERQKKQDAADQAKAEKKARKEREAQFEKAEKLKKYAFVAAEKFVKNSLKAPSSAKFAFYKDSSVMWWQGNIFLVTVIVDAQNSYGAMIRQTIMCEIEHVDESDWSWKLLQMGSPEQVMRNKAPDLVKAVDSK